MRRLLPVSLLLFSLTLTSSSGAAGRRFPPFAARAVPSASLTVPLSIDKTVTGPDGKSYRLSGTLSVTVTDAVPPPPPPVPLSLASVTLAPPVISPGQSAVFTVTMNRAVTVATPAIFRSSDPLVAPITGSGTIQPGQATMSAAVIARTVTASKTVTITVTYNGQSMSANLQVNPVPAPPPPPPPPGPALLTDLAITGPNPVPSGASTTATVYLSQPASQDTLIALSSGSDPAVPMPPSVLLLAGQQTVSFTVPTGPVPPGESVEPALDAQLGQQSADCDLLILGPGAVGPAPMVRSVGSVGSVGSEAARITAVLDAGGRRVTQPHAFDVLTLVGENLGAPGRIVVRELELAEIQAWSESAVRFVMPPIWDRGTPDHGAHSKLPFPVTRSEPVLLFPGPAAGSDGSDRSDRSVRSEAGRFTGEVVAVPLLELPPPELRPRK